MTERIIKRTAFYLGVLGLSLGLWWALISAIIAGLEVLR